ncbi:response regulator transcription factor [Kitasatospora sp. NPDC057198]|uniref:response regulator transcription factor n=1 Tax=Kitasatospora sp. NPDC057198 TaxID=3346046 RepID=UPI00362AD5AA
MERVARAAEAEAEVPYWVRAALDRVGGLSEREAEVLALLPDGLSNRMIARNLGISESTVKFHLGSIAKKLSLRTRVEIAVIAYEWSFSRPGALGARVR